MKFEELNWDAPKLLTDLPGPNSKKMLKRQWEIEGNPVSYPKGLPIAFEKGKGATIKDVDGNIFIDFFGGAGVMTLGHGNPVVIDAIKSQLDKITHVLDFPTKIRLELVEYLRKIMPGNLKNKVKVTFGGPTGSDAIESAIKLVKHVTNRHSLIAFEGSYHGQTAGAVTVSSGKAFKEKIAPMLPDVHFAPYGYCYRCAFNKSREDCQLECAMYFHHLLEDPHSGIVHPAGMIMEPIQGEGGSVIPPEKFVKQVEKSCREYEVPVIFDEIQSGFCRTGQFFAFQHSGAMPDIMAISKAIGGGLPLSAIVYREDYDVWNKGSHIGTFRGNAPAMAAGVASLDFMLEHDLPRYARELGDFILSKLKRGTKNLEIVGEVRGKGLMLGIEIVKDKDSRKPSPEIAAEVRSAVFKKGVLLEMGGHYGNVARMLPSLVITKKLVEIGTEIVIEALEDVERKFK